MSRITHLSLVLVSCLLCSTAVGQENATEPIESVFDQANAIQQVQLFGNRRQGQTGVLGRMFGAGTTRNTRPMRQQYSTPRPYRSSAVPRPPALSGGSTSAPAPAPTSNPYGGFPTTGQVAPGQPQPLMDPDEREEWLQEREQAMEAIPSADDYDSSGQYIDEPEPEPQVETFSTGSQSEGESVSIDRSFSSTTSSRRQGRRTTFAPEPTEIVDDEPISTTPVVPRKSIPMSVEPDAVIEPPRPVQIEVEEPADSFTSSTRTSTTRTAITQAPQRTYQQPEPPAPVVEVEPRDHNGRIITSEIPMIRVLTHGPEEIQLNQVGEYSIVVENKGSFDAPGVVIRASLPKWAMVRSHQATKGDVEPQPHEGERRLLWQISNLPAGKSETLTLRIAPERAETFDVGVEWTVMPQQRVAHVKVQQPRLKLMIEGPDDVIYGESRIYKVRVMNPGNGVANDVTFTLSPHSATPQSQRIGTIPPGKEAQFEIELTAQDPGGLEIHGLAAGAQDLRDEAIKQVRVLTADLVATLSGPPTKYHNSLVNYQLNVKNEGTATSKDVVAVLRLPHGVEYKSGISGAEAVGEFLRWRADSLAPGESANYDLECMLTGVGDHLLAFECRGTAAGRAMVSLSTKVEALADLVLTINDPAAPAPVGETVSYEIVIHNRGSRAAEGVRAIAQFSNGIEPIRVNGHAGEIVPGQVLFDSIGRIEPGQEVKLLVQAKANSEAHHRFRAEVTAGETVLVAEEATRFIQVSQERISRHSSNSRTQR